MGLDFSAGAEEVQVLQVEGGIDGSKLVKKCSVMTWTGFCVAN